VKKQRAQNEEQVKSPQSRGTVFEPRRREIRFCLFLYPAFTKPSREHRHNTRLCRSVMDRPQRALQCEIPCFLVC
jgi:hypothetical protein